MSPPVLVTPRLRLRPLRRTDCDDIYAYARDPLVAEHLLWDAHTSLDDTHTYLGLAESRFQSGSAIEWGVEYQGHVVGTVGFFDRRDDHLRAELGYALARPVWGRGLATEAAAAVVAHGFGALRFERIVATTRVENTSSQRVLEKLGFLREGTLRHHLFVKQEWWDIAYYGLLKHPRSSG